MQLSQKHKSFCEFFTEFFKYTSNFEHFDKKDDPYRFCISGITDSENVIIQMYKNSRFRGPLEKKHGKRAEPLSKSASQHVHHIHWSLPRQLSWKKSLFLTYQILGLVVNTLPVDETYPVLNRDNLTIPIEMELSQKKKIFSQFFAPFLKSTSNFQSLKLKADPHKFCIFEITDSECVAR